jgi:ketosteroid isomerase-like protein
VIVGSTLEVSVKKFLAIMILGVLSLTAFGLRMQAQQSNDEALIRAAMADSVTAWNAGDLKAFVSYYEDSPLTTFVGPKNTYGTGDLLLLPTSTGVVEYAIMTGHFHLDRTARGEAKKDDGYYSLVWHKTKDGWKIILDHTS